MTLHISDPMEREKLLYKLTERSIGTKLLIKKPKGKSSSQLSHVLLGNNCLL